MDTRLSKDVKSEYYKEYENLEKKTVREKIRVTTRVYSMRKETQERRSWKKFGEVADLERGAHRTGDLLIGGEINIETEEGAQQQEIDIVKKFAALTTETIKMKKQEEKIKNMNKQEDMDELGSDFDLEELEKPKKPLREQKTGAQKLLDMESFANASQDVSIQIRNLASFSLAISKREQDELQEDFRAFLEAYIGASDHTNRYRSRFVRIRGYGYTEEFPAPLRDIAYISFNLKDKAELAVQQLDGRNFQNCIIQAEVTKDRRK